MLAAVAVATYGKPSASEDRAAALVSRARAALGTGLGHVKSLHLAGTFSTGDISGTTESWIDLTNGRFAKYTKAGPMTRASGYDGRTAWRSDSKGISLPQTGPLAKAITASDIFDNAYELFNPDYGGARVSYLGTKSDAGKTYEAISAEPKGGCAEEVWFDPASGLPARTIVDYGPRSTTIRLSGYSAVNGLMIPGEMTMTERWDFRDFYGHKQGDISRDSIIKYTTVEANVRDLDSHFRMPSSPIRDVSLSGGETRIPFEMQNFWILINVRLNGKGPFSMMLDSGGGNVLSPSVAAEVGARETGWAPQRSSIPGLRDLRFARVDSVKIGGATLTDQDFIVGHIGNIFTRDGMIGPELFERFVTTIDYASRQIILRSPGTSPYTQSDTAGEISLPLRFDDTKPEIACKVAGVDASCIADTGAGVALILSGPFVKSNSSVQPPWYAGAYGRVLGSGGFSEVRYGPLGSFQIGPFTLTNVNTLFTTEGNGALDLYPSALVGNRIWRRFTVTFDFAHSALRLTPNAQFGG